MKTISVAMCTYNGAAYVEAQLKSLAEQTFLPQEVIVADDGSTDDTAMRVTEFGKTAPFNVIYYKNDKQLGFRANFMGAAVRCKSELIAFCDQDDYWLPNKLESCARAFENKDVLLAVHNASVTNEKLEVQGVLNEPGFLPDLSSAQSLDPFFLTPGFTQIFDRRLMVFVPDWINSLDHRSPDTREAHDQWFFYLASALGMIAYLEEPLALYRQHGRNTIGHNRSIGLREKWRRLNASAFDGLAIRELAMTKRVECLKQAIGNSVFEPSLLAQAIAGYGLLATSYSKRQKMYRSRTRLGRSVQICKLIVDGSYRDRSRWGSGSQAFVRDLAFGVVLGMSEAK